MTSFTHCPVCDQTYPSDEGHNCSGSIRQVRTAAQEWIKCSECNTDYPIGTSHRCSTTAKK